MEGFDVSLQVTRDAGTLRIVTPAYAWAWNEQDDTLTLTDRLGNVIATGPIQPSVVVDRDGQKAAPGTPRLDTVSDDTIGITYVGANGHATITTTWRFEDTRFWLEPIGYASTATESIVRLFHFGQWDGSDVRPTLQSHYHVIPGLTMTTALGPVVNADARFRLTAGIGGRRHGDSGLHQQWGLPAHYICGFHRNAGPNEIGAVTTHLSEAFCCGFATLSEGDAWVRIEGGAISPVINIRGDLWGHRQGPGEFTLGPRLLFTIGETYHAAIQAYYRTLLELGQIASLDGRTSDRKRRAMLTSQFNTWGVQEARGMRPTDLNSAVLSGIYDEFRGSGMAAGMFVIDDKWEGVYGKLEHDPARFPDFEGFLQRVRADGLLVGMWAAFLRCQDPSVLGLTYNHVLKRPDGTPFRLGSGDHAYSIFDFTQPIVQDVLRDVAQRFVRRYNPDLVKFDFGYELPSLEEAAPADLAWSGERLLEKGLEVILGAMREVNPDLVVMYYGISPLLSSYYDLHSPDDLCFNPGEYGLEANRRFFFSGICGEFGMPTYSSSGYDWESAADIWFDAAPLGPVGSLHDFTGDERGGTPTPTILARYNGVARVRRPTLSFTMEPLEVAYVHAATGATARSWVRHEQGSPYLIALRPARRGGRNAYRDLLTTDAAVVVSALGTDPLGVTLDLGIVPFGEGMMELAVPPTVDRVTVRTHLFGGGGAESPVEIRDGRIRLELSETTGAGDPIEWLEVTAPVEGSH